MRHRLRLGIIAMVSCATVVALAGTASFADPAWTAAQSLAGLATLNVTGTANADDISCSSAGNCGLVGTYTDSLRDVQGFTATEVAGVWGGAEPIPGLGDLALNGVGDTMVISCSGTGDCSAGGTYIDGSGTSHAFAVNEHAGAWGTAQTLPLGASLPVLAPSTFANLTCTAPGQCVAVGGYATSTAAQSFVATETGGVWAGAIDVPGTQALNAGGESLGTSLACVSASACTMSGIYTDASGQLQVYVDNSSGGVWGTATAVSGLVGLNSGGAALASDTACSSLGNCAIGGTYTISGGALEAFVADEDHGVWGSAEELPGSGALNVGGAAAVASLACPSDGVCEAVGVYADSPATAEAFVAQRTGGQWQSAIQFPGIAELNAGESAAAQSVSCVAPGDCRAVGGYTDVAKAGQSFDASEVGGIWQNVEETPGSAALNTEGSSQLEWLSCTPDGGCAAAGVYKDASGFTQVMTFNTAAMVSAPPPTAPGAPKIRAVSRSKGDLTVSVVVKPTTGGAAVTAYQYSLNGGAWRRASGGATSFTLKHLKSGRRDKVRVRAVDSVGTGAASAAVSVKVR